VLRDSSETREQICQVYDLYFICHDFNEDYDGLDLDVCEECEPDVYAAVQLAVQAVKDSKNP
jgi:hypothetical protein